MSETYDGDANNYPASLTMPTDDDPPTEATFRPSLDGLADRTAALKDGALSITGEKTFADDAHFSSNVDVAGFIASTTTPTKRHLLWSIPTGTVNVRLYSRASDNSPPYSQGLDLTLNAEWTGTEWQADVNTADAFIYELFNIPNSWATLDTFLGEGSLFTIRTKDVTTTNWTETGWDAGHLSLGAGMPEPKEVVSANTVYQKFMPKAWAYVETDGAGGVSIEDGVGWDEVTIDGGELVFTLRRQMANATYCVNIGQIGHTYKPALTGQLDTEFNIEFRDAANANVDPATNVVRVMVSVFGEHA